MTQRKVRIWVVLSAACLVYAALCLFMWAEQRYLLYHPSKAILAPQAYGLAGFSDVTLHDPDGTSIDAWQHPAAPDYPTLVFFHGKGGNMGSFAPYFGALAKAGFGLLAIDYRGFGKSSGAPTEAGLYEDARTAMHYAEGTLHIPASGIVLYGQSLGTGVAVQMATEFPVAALVLQSPYTSIAAVGKVRYPWLPVDLLLDDRFDSIAKIAQIHMPLLLMHGTQDTVVPVAEGKQLFAEAGEPKQAVYFPGLNHNNLDIAARINALMAFARSDKLIR